jgi:hypothetical protein
MAPLSLMPQCCWTKTLMRTRTRCFPQTRRSEAGPAGTRPCDHVRDGQRVDAIRWLIDQFEWEERLAHFRREDETPVPTSTRAL